MDRGRLFIGAVPPAIAGIAAACLFFSPATPVVAVGDEGLRKALEDPDEKGRLAVPFPRLMRLVERARRAIRGMKHPVANAPAGSNGVENAATVRAAPVSESRETPPDQMGLSAPPGRTDADPALPASLYDTATR